ncbi:ComF family protein [Patulibacter defluvii]|uniref:ComF family protein n=1 Tax=Patulibacter defluvii TaxID=3095358 RepID=UPI002A74E97B|nr:phosphoribosyltransferase family protein [Patulibacter sp. DM4]
MPRLADLLAALIAPDRCLHCRGPARGGALLCDGCRGALPWLPVDGCPRCALPQPCPPRRCPARAAPFAAAWAPLAYEGPARSLALAAKERAAERTCRWLGAAIVARLPESLAAGAPTVVPVAADPARRRRRGVDHARLIAAAVAAGLDAPLLPLLERERAAVAQHHRDRGDRLRLPPPRVRGPVPPTVLLVDDVHTTGATLRGAAAALRDAGAERVVAATAFRTLP